MYDIRQFRPALYALLLLGFTGYALAAQAPALWVFAVAATVLNAWLVATGRFTPLPRFVANAVTLLVFLFVAQQLLHGRNTPILVIGQFLVILQVVKLYEQRANRDFAQLLVLSLLLMVAAAINTASLVFGLMLLGYLFLSLYCCLLFHLKSETDVAKEQYALPEEKVRAGALRQDQLYLSRSMRRLTGLVAGASVFTAVLAFLFIPRGTGAGMLGPLQFRSGESLTGFSDEVSFQQVAKIQQNNTEVAHVAVWKDDQPVNGSVVLLLRGMVLDKYDTANGAYRWLRAPPQPVRGTGGEPTGPTWRQKVDLYPTGSKVLFALPGLIEPPKPARDIRIIFSPFDRVATTDEYFGRPLQYEAVSREGPVPPPDGWSPLLNAPVSDIDPQVKAYALRDDVGGPPARQRLPLSVPQAADAEIARRIETHLRDTFAYTLDLTDARRVRDRDPVVAFLYDFKRGHCEYFAGAMTLMCQSLGMQARMVIGFKCDEFNPQIGMYTVRQSHAHAWVEVLTLRGWQTFDPTTARGAPTSAANLSAWKRVRNFFDYLQYTYANKVVAYDNENRENLITNLNATMTNTAINSSGAVSAVGERVRAAVDFLATRAIGPVMALLVVGLATAVGVFVYERLRLRRRARRIGLEVLPEAEQLQLARQLGFYDDLIRLLERHRIARPDHLTPREFADSLSFLPYETYTALRRMTGIFYRIRFGRQHLTGSQQRRLYKVIQRVADTLGPEPA